MNGQIYKERFYGNHHRLEVKVKSVLFKVEFCTKEEIELLPSEIFVVSQPKRNSALQIEDVLEESNVLDIRSRHPFRCF